MFALVVLLLHAAVAQTCQNIEATSSTGPFADEYIVGMVQGNDCNTTNFIALGIANIATANPFFNTHPSHFFPVGTCGYFKIVGPHVNFSYNNVTDQLISCADFLCVPFAGANVTAQSIYPNVASFAYLNTMIVTVGSQTSACRIDNLRNGDTLYSPSSLFVPAGVVYHWVYYNQYFANTTFNISAVWDAKIFCTCQITITLGYKYSCPAGPPPQPHHRATVPTTTTTTVPPTTTTTAPPTTTTTTVPLTTTVPPTTTTTTTVPLTTIVPPTTTPAQPVECNYTGYIVAVSILGSAVLILLILLLCVGFQSKKRTWIPRKSRNRF